MERALKERPPIETVQHQLEALQSGLNQFQRR